MQTIKSFFSSIPKETGRKILNFAGLGLGFAGIIFIILKFRDYGWKIDFGAIPASTWWILLFMALVYFGACFLLAFAWHNILLFLGLRVNRAWSVRTYGISQLAKYVPGNIFQFASRQAIGVADGLPGVPLAKSIFWELLLLASTGALFAVLALPLFWKPITQLLGILVFLIFAVGFLLALYLKKNRRIGIAAFFYLVFLMVSGVVFLLIANSLGTLSLNKPAVYLGILGAYIFAWLVGLITPGAPAGAGIREAVLFLLLKGIIAQQDLLLAIILTRIASILGDTFFYFFALWIKKSNPIL